MPSPSNAGTFSPAAIRAFLENSESNDVARGKATLPVLDGLECEPTSWGGEVVRDDDDGYADDEQRRTQTQWAADGIHELYRTGVPFFSKAAIRSLVGQIDRTNDLVRRVGRTSAVERERFVLEGLDGEEIRFRMETGEVHETRDGGWELVKMDPMLHYQCYQQLTGNHAFMWSSKLTCCPLRIIYRRHLRDSKSKVSIPLEDLQEIDRRKGWPPAEETVRREFDTCLTDWEENNELRRRLESALEEVSLPVVTKIVAFACATISDNELPSARLQHVLLLSLKRILETCHQQSRTQKQTAGNGCDTSLWAPESTTSTAVPTMSSVTHSAIQCFAQDPAYNNVDKAILAEHGVTVLDDPRGFLQVDDQSAVLSFAPNICVRQIVADIARPALLIWNTVRGEEESMTLWRARFGESRKFESLHELEGCLTDPESPRLRDMVRNEYTEVMKVEHDNLGSDISVYVRKS